MLTLLNVGLEQVSQLPQQRSTLWAPVAWPGTEDEAMGQAFRASAPQNFDGCCMLLSCSGNGWGLVCSRWRVPGVLAALLSRARILHRERPRSTSRNRSGCVSKRA